MLIGKKHVPLSSLLFIYNFSMHHIDEKMVDEEWGEGGMCVAVQ